MEFNLVEGMKGIIEVVVAEKHSAKAANSELVDVYSTPAMIELMEVTAHSSISGNLPEGYTTVGMDVNIKHMKATPIGMKVKCVATLKEVKGKKLVFEVEAFDEVGKIGEGIHNRYIVNHDDFLKKV